METFGDEPTGEQDGELTFSDRHELLSYMRQFGDPEMKKEADAMANETRADMARNSVRLATAMYRSGEIEAGEFEIIRSQIDMLLDLDQATEWAEELEADIERRQLTGDLPQNEELDAALEEALTPPIPTVEQIVEAQMNALHEQAEFLGLSQFEIAQAEAEIRRDAEELLREEQAEQRSDTEPPMGWAA